MGGGKARGPVAQQNARIHSSKARSGWVEVKREMGGVAFTASRTKRRTEQTACEPEHKDSSCQICSVGVSPVGRASLPSAWEWRGELGCGDGIKGTTGIGRNGEGGGHEQKVD